MTKNDTEIARHDERLKVLEDWRLEVHADLKDIKAASSDQNIKLVKYRNSNAMWALTLATFNGIITSVALILTGQTDKLLALFDKLFS